MKPKILEEVKKVGLGDLVRVEWCDASIGKSLGSGMAVDVTVSSWGLFIGVLGEKSKHVILAQNNFRYADGLYDIDYTAIPLTWTVKILVIAKNCIQAGDAKELLHSFLMGGRRAIPKRKRQERVVNHHERLD
jgi:hypothetical protein